MLKNIFREYYNKNKIFTESTGKMNNRCFHVTRNSLQFLLLVNKYVNKLETPCAHLCARNFDLFVIIAGLKNNNQVSEIFDE